MHLSRIAYRSSSWLLYIAACMLLLIGRALNEFGQFPEMYWNVPNASLAFLAAVSWAIHSWNLFFHSHICLDLYIPSSSVEELTVRLPNYPNYPQRLIIIYLNFPMTEGFPHLHLSFGSPTLLPGTPLHVRFEDLPLTASWVGLGWRFQDWCDLLQTRQF